jgi:hypothetical protein
MPEYQRKTLAAYLTTKLNWDRKHHIWKWNEPGKLIYKRERERERERDNGEYG